MGCGCGFYGQLSVSPGNTDPVYTTPIRRQGERATFVLDVLEILGSDDLLVSIESKNEDETSWGLAGSFASGITSKGVYTLTLSGLKQLVRWRFAFDTSVAAGDLFRVQKDVIWFPY